MLVSNGLSAFALNQFSSEILYKQVENLLIEEYKSENDYSDGKQYDEDERRFWEYPRCVLQFCHWHIHGNETSKH